MAAVTKNAISVTVRDRAKFYKKKQNGRLENKCNLGNGEK